MTIIQHLMMADLWKAHMIDYKDYPVVQKNYYKYVVWHLSIVKRELNTYRGE